MPCLPITLNSFFILRRTLRPITTQDANCAVLSIFPGLTAFLTPAYRAICYGYKCNLHVESSKCKLDSVNMKTITISIHK